MTRPDGPILYDLGWKGYIGAVLVEIVQIKIGEWRLKKAVRISEA